MLLTILNKGFLFHPRPMCRLDMSDYNEKLDMCVKALSLGQYHKKVLRDTFSEEPFI